MHPKQVGWWWWLAAVGAPVLTVAASIAVNLESQTWLALSRSDIQSVTPDAVLYSTWALIVGAPLAGVAHGSQRRRLLAAIALFVMASATMNVLAWGSGNEALAFVAASHATLASVALALVAFGELCGVMFRDPLDAAAWALGVVLLLTGGVLVAGASVADAPRGVIEAALMASPIVAVASAAGIDIVRTDTLYQLSPLAHIRFDYPTWYAATGWHLFVAGLSFAAVSLKASLKTRTIDRFPLRERISMRRLSRPLVCVLCVQLGVSSAALAQQSSPRRATTANTALSNTTLSPELQKRLRDSLNRAEAYLRQQQKPDGTWEDHPGITALAAAALLRQPGAARAKQLEAVGKSLDSLARLAKPDGGIYDKIIPHYITAVSTMALVAGGRPQDRPIIEKARVYLAKNLLDEDEGVSANDKWYGGMGYGATTRADGRRADIISLEYALQAMKDAELPRNDAAWEKAIKFLQRTQNNSETNDQAWAANDGGFVYYPGFTYHTDGGTRSYGSATYAGILSYSWANVRKDDQRVQAVGKWIRDNYTVDENPGMGQKTVYYYYMVFAKALQALGEPTIVDARGRSHTWREELGRKLLSLQHPEGYWINEVKDEMQDNKVLVTAFTMTAIQAILQ